MRAAPLVVSMLLLAGCSEVPDPSAAGGGRPAGRDSITDGDRTSYINGTVAGVGECNLGQVFPVDRLHTLTSVAPAFWERRYKEVRFTEDVFHEGDLCMRWVNGAGQYVNETNFGHEVVPTDAIFVLVMGGIHEEAAFTIEILPRDRHPSE